MPIETSPALIFAAITVLLLVVFIVIIASNRSTARRPCPRCNRAVSVRQHTCPHCETPLRHGTRTTDLKRDPTPAGGPYLACVAGPLGGRNLPLDSDQVPIGRGTGNRLQLEGTLVSRQHALIILDEDRYLLYDRESTNGTYVNGQRIAQHVLQAGDQIQIGAYVFIFQLAGSAVALQPLVQPAVRVTTPEAVASRRVAFEDYVRQDTIGGGGMAKVYKAVSRRDGSLVAIKVFHQSDPYLRDKFDQEVLIGRDHLSNPPHPHIARVYGGGESQGVFYMVMEYVDNLSLRERLRPGEPLHADVVVPVIGQTCDALNYAHRKGVFHRDIKPENILFASQDGIKLVDFGIAKLATSVTHTMDGMIVGTPVYMSYEQAKGQRVNATSDLYSLGVVLYEMLTGAPPFTGEPLTVVHKHITEQPVPPRRINPSIPPNAEAVVMRALDKRSAMRFQSAEEMARALGYDAAFHVPVAGEPVSQGRPGSVPTGGLHPRSGLGNQVVPARLVVIGSGKTLPLVAGTTVIHRRDINSADHLISREHARVIRHEGSFWLEDTGSKNGTYLNEQRIFEPVLMRPGDGVRIGRTQLRFEQMRG